MSLQAAALYALVSVAGADKSISDLRRVSGQVNATQTVMGGLARNAGQISKGVGQVAGGLVRVGEYAAIAAAGAGVAAAKTAIDFQDAFATVEKTVEGTPAQLDKIDQGLRRLSTNIPVTFQSLTTIASEAGALGVKTKDIEKFTEAVARTSAATVGLDPFMASEAFGKLSTIFSLTGDHIDQTTGKIMSDYDRLGSALVALGNVGASSESEIIDVSKYFAQAGQQAGLSAAQVLAWGSAVTSLGMEPEAGGGALQRVFQRVTTNIAIGSEKIQSWAKVSGMSVKQFTKAFGEDASGAVIKFLEGLSKMDKFAAAKALKEGGVINQRDVRAILALSQHVPVLTYQLGVSTKAWDENTALMAVSEKRFDTLKSKVTEFGNTMKVGAAAVGDGMVPALGRLVAKAKDFVSVHMTDLENLGKDIGAAIDNIDWVKVQSGAQTLVDILKAGFDIISKVPPEIDAAVAGFLALNKVSGGLLGAGLGNIAGGVLGIGGSLARGLLYQVPGIGRALAAATVLHVWVDNMPAGGFGGGGAPAILPEAGAGAAAAAGGIGAGSVAAGAGLLTLGALITFKSMTEAAAKNQIISDRYGGLTEKQIAAVKYYQGDQVFQEQFFKHMGYRPTREDYMAAITHAATIAIPASDRNPDRTERNAAAWHPALPADRSQRENLAMQAVLQRALNKGYRPTQEAVTATYERTVARHDAAVQAAADRAAEAARSSADAADRLARSERTQSGQINLQITVPGVKAYQQVINETRYYGPNVPNAPRHASGTGPLP